MTKLSVNINKIATLRNARGAELPSVTEWAKRIESYGAQGITIHPRPDERHITKKDTYDLSKTVTTEFNIEGYPDQRFMELIEKLRPTQATLVPDPPHVLTSNAGWDTVLQGDFLQNVITKINSWGVRTSLFTDTQEQNIKGAKLCGANRIELYTGPYAEQFYTNKSEAVKPFVQAALLAKELGLGLNAGHDLNMDNLAYFKQHCIDLLEVSIGHALISDALLLGMENTVRRYLFLLED